MARKKWCITYPGASDITWPSEAGAYDYVNDLRERWAAGATLIGALTVQVDEGSGWEPHEHINFAEEGKDQ